MGDCQARFREKGGRNYLHLLDNFKVMNRKIFSIIVMMFLACNQVIATSPPQTIVMGEQFFDPSVVKHPPHRIPASFEKYFNGKFSKFLSYNRFIVNHIIGL